MKFQITGLCGLASVASAFTTRPSMFARQDSQEAATCIDCTVPLVANSDFANGVVAEGNYYIPTKTGNWLLADTANGVGELSVVQDPTGNYLRNFCAKGRTGYCSVYLAQVVTVQAGVSYDFQAQYAISGVRGTVNTVSVQLGSLDKRTRYFEQFTYAGNTDWTTFGTSEWVSPVSGDILMTVVWRNDPNDGIVKYRSLKLEAVECRKVDSPLDCANQQTSTTTTAAATTTTSDATTTTTDATVTTTTSDTTTSATDSTSTTATATTTTSDTTTSTTGSTSTTASTTDSTTASATSTQASTTLLTRTRRPGKCGRKTRTRTTASTTSDIASSTTATSGIVSSTTAAAATTESDTVAVAPTTTTSGVAVSTTVVQTMTVY